MEKREDDDMISRIASVGCQGFPGSLQPAVFTLSATWGPCRGWQWAPRIAKRPLQTQLKLLHPSIVTLSWWSCHCLPPHTLTAGAQTPCTLRTTVAHSTSCFCVNKQTIPLAYDPCQYLNLSEPDNIMHYGFMVFCGISFVYQSECHLASVLMLYNCSDIGGYLKKTTGYFSIDFEVYILFIYKCYLMCL